MAQARVRLTISGTVQGVFYRASARDEAERLGLTGWVRNLINGDVEALAEGPEALVEQFIDWCRVGPPAARVEQVEVEREEYRGEYQRFSVAR
jgi:acylphosphatase